MDDLESTLKNTHIALSTSPDANRLHLPPGLFETPSKQNMSSTNVFVNGDLKSQKKAVEEDLGPIPQITVDFMLQHIVPNSNVDVEATMEELQKNGTLAQSGRWKPFEKHSPKKMSTMSGTSGAVTGERRRNKEAEVFENMLTIYNSIISSTRFHVQPSPPQTLEFKQNPNLAPSSDTEVRTRPDGYGVLEPQQQIHSNHLNLPSQRPGARNPKVPRRPDPQVSKPVDWFDIAFVEEYKLNNRPKDRNDNVLKIIWSLHHIMNLDHRRRFAFGITIEDEMTRIWFCCRQIVLVTQPFNFNKKPSRLVHLIASLAFAQPTQLGYDPTMKLRSGPKGACYDIECMDKDRDGSKHIYRTEKVISARDYNLRGRATRVYLVKRLLDPDAEDVPEDSPQFILKDSWIDVGRCKEGDILRKLLEGASEDEKKRFLTVHQHGVVQIDSQDDSTEELMLKGQKIEIEPDAYLDSESEDSSDGDASGQEGDSVPDTEKFTFFRLSIPENKTRNSSGPASGPIGDGLRQNTFYVPKMPIRYSPKVHYRIVFKEYGVPLKSLLDKGRATNETVERVMRDIVKALQFMARRGYVHRDISLGNILCFPGHAKLADLEYAKEYGQGACSYIRTGTYSFMAGEAMTRVYAVAPNPIISNKIPFVYNPIHDLEALWWVGTFCNISHYPAPIDETKSTPQDGQDMGTSASYSQYEYRAHNDAEERRIKELKRHSKMLFPSFFDQQVYLFRIMEIHDRFRFKSRIGTEYPVISQVRQSCLDDIRQCISLAYQAIQAKLPREDVSYFTDLLRIGVPAIPMGMGEETGVEEISVHDRVLQIIDTMGQNAAMQSLKHAVIWPLDFKKAEQAIFHSKQPHGIFNMMDTNRMLHED